LIFKGKWEDVHNLAKRVVVYYGRNIDLKETEMEYADSESWTRDNIRGRKKIYGRLN